LILLTNDGDIVNAILRVEYGHEREYHVETDREFDRDFLARMGSGVVILGKKTRPCLLQRLGPKRFSIVLTEGRNRQIRRMCRQLGYRVVVLHRVRIMDVMLEGLLPGQWKELSKGERNRLFAALGRKGERAICS
jgi:23S rRNA pseudouridine2604 synthase